MGGTDDGRAEGQSSGDSTRRAFVGLLLLALLSRAVLLPVQAWFYYPPPPPGGDGGQGGGGRQPQLRHIEPTSGLCVGSALCVLSRTLPCLTFATAFSLLVLYYAQLAGTAGGGGPRGYWAEALTSRSFFRACNSAMYSVYGLAYLAAAYVPGVPYGLFQTVVWSMLCGVYLALLGCLGWFGPVLLRLLRPSLERRTALALRLSATCAVCAAVFLARAVFLGRAVSRATASWEEVKEEDWDGGRDQVGGQGGGDHRPGGGHGRFLPGPERRGLEEAGRDAPGVRPARAAPRCRDSGHDDAPGEGGEGRRGGGCHPPRPEPQPLPGVGRWRDSSAPPLRRLLPALAPAAAARDGDSPPRRRRRRRPGDAGRGPGVAAVLLGRRGRGSRDGHDHDDGGDRDAPVPVWIVGQASKEPPRGLRGGAPPAAPERVRFPVGVGGGGGRVRIGIRIQSRIRRRWSRSQDVDRALWWGSPNQLRRTQL